VSTRGAALLLLLATAVLVSAPVRAREVAVRAQRLHTSGPRGTIEDAVIVIRDGVVSEVGPAADISIPDGIPVLDAAVVTPGLIDTQTAAGLAGQYNVAADQDADERAGPNQAGLRAIDGLNPREPLLGWLLAHGVTVVQAGPGEANAIGGLAGVFKTTGGSVEAMTLRFPSALLFSLGERPKSTYAEAKQAPMTRMGTAALIRSALAEARDGEDENDDEPPARDLHREALRRVLDREIPALFTARREDDIHTALRIGREFGLRVEIADGIDGYLMTDALLEAGVPVHVGPVMERLGGIETLNASFENAAILADAGIPISFRSGYEAYVPKTRVVLFEAAVAAANGLGAERALRALTLDAAQRLGVDEQVGSLEPGKDGDLVLFDGDPFEYTTHVEAVIVSGHLAHRRPN